MPTGPEVRRDGRRRVVGTVSATTSVPVYRGLRAAHVHDLVVRPGEAAAVVATPLQGAAGGITEPSEA
jgi:hypothetical protein